MSHDAAGLIADPGFMQGFRKGLHDVCQPLTTLQCRLYLGSLEDDPALIRDGMAKCQVECDQVIQRVAKLQRWLEEQGERDPGAQNDFSTD